MNDETFPDTSPDGSAAKQARSEGPENGDGNGNWVMPEPIFRQTSGSLPKEFEKRLRPTGAQAVPSADELGQTPSDEPSLPPVEQSSPPDPNVEAVTEIVPQPDLTEEFLLSDVVEPDPEPAAAQTGTGTRLAFAALVVIGILLLAAVFLAVVYYLFFYSPNGLNDLN